MAAAEAAAPAEAPVLAAAATRAAAVPSHSLADNPVLNNLSPMPERSTPRNRAAAHSILLSTSRKAVAAAVLPDRTATTAGHPVRAPDLAVAQALMADLVLPIRMRLLHLLHLLMVAPVVAAPVANREMAATQAAVPAGLE